MTNKTMTRSKKPKARKRVGSGPAPGARNSTAGDRAAGDRAAGERLQKVLAAAGHGSRRACEELIVAGRVEVDGQVADVLGTRVDTSRQQVRVDGVALPKQRFRYYLLNKPSGVVCTNRDPSGRTRAIDLVPAEQRLFTVGRLDLNSEGLILLTNDGDLANELAHPRYGVEKIYEVEVAGRPEAEHLRQLRAGVYLAEAFVKADGVRIKRRRPHSTLLEVTLREGKNREIRRMLARIGHKVLRLRRIALGPLRLGNVPAGAFRELTSAEVERLRERKPAKKTSKKTARSGKRPASRADAAPRAKTRPGKKPPTSKQRAAPAKGRR